MKVVRAAEWHLRGPEQRDRASIVVKQVCVVVVSLNIHLKAPYRPVGDCGVSPAGISLLNNGAEGFRLPAAEACLVLRRNINL